MGDADPEDPLRIERFPLDWRRYAPAEDGRAALRIVFRHSGWGAWPSEVVVSEGPRLVSVTLFERILHGTLPSGELVGPPMHLRHSAIEVALRAPLGSRRVIDGATGTAGAPLLPDAEGWAAVREGCPVWQLGSAGGAAFVLARRPHALTAYRAVDDRHALHVVWHHPGSDGAPPAEILVVESGELVAVTVLARSLRGVRPNGSRVTSTRERRVSAVEIALARPLGDRRVLDAARGEALPRLDAPGQAPVRAILSRHVPRWVA